jgi:ketosteroid isomerase-like protein
MRLRLTLALLFSLSCAASIVTAQVAPKRIPTCNEVIVRDSSHPVWKAIDAQYARLAEAMRKRDLDALFALYTPDFHAVTPTGEVWTRERSLAYQRNGLAQVKETTHISNTILRLTICGDEATATVLQQWYRTQMMVGKSRRVETNAVQDEKWVKMPDGWKRGDINEVKNGAAFVDGKRVDTNKPYDPEAPAYDPMTRAPNSLSRMRFSNLLWIRESNRLSGNSTR